MQTFRGVPGHHHGTYKSVTGQSPRRFRGIFRSNQDSDPALYSYIEIRIPQ